MNYTIKKSSVIFELPLSDYLGKTDAYASKRIYTPEEFAASNGHASGVYTDRHGWQTEEEAKKQGLYNKVIRVRSGYRNIVSLQDYEETSYDNFTPMEWQYLPDDLEDYKEEAIKYLLTLPGKYTKEEIETAGNLEDDIKRALADAWDSSYQDEWNTKFIDMTQEKIDEDLQDNLKSLSYKLLDRLDDKEFQSQRTDQQFLRLEISKQDIKNWLKENYPSEDWHKDKDYIDYFADYALDFERKPIDPDYIDRYGSMGSCDRWLDCFKDMQETTSAIDKYRKDEADKIDNAERASLELKSHLTAIDQYAAKYFTKEETRQKIARQVTALKSVIKNAV